MESVISLSSIFADNSNEKFNRLLKPEEFIPPPKKINDEQKTRKKRKPKKDTAIIETAVEEIKHSESEPLREASDECLNRTVFLGNLPLSETVKSVKAFCKDFGVIESVRLRSVPIAG